MLRTLGAPSLNELIERVVPGGIRLRERLDVTTALTESEYLEHIDGLASQNTLFRNYIGMGYYPTEVPSVIRRNVLENPGWYTAYTPYLNTIPPELEVRSSGNQELESKIRSIIRWNAQ